MNMTQTQHVLLGYLIWLGEADHDVPTRVPLLLNWNPPAPLIRARQTAPALCRHRGI